MRWHEDTRAATCPSLTNLRSAYAGSNVPIADQSQIGFQKCSPADGITAAAEMSGIRHVPPTTLRLGYIISAEVATAAIGTKRRKSMSALMSAFGRIVLQNYFSTPARKIDSRSRSHPQHR